jgi:hypothetical protein
MYLLLLLRTSHSFREPLSPLLPAEWWVLPFYSPKEEKETTVNRQTKDKIETLPRSLFLVSEVGNSAKQYGTFQTRHSHHVSYPQQLRIDRYTRFSPSSQTQPCALCSPLQDAAPLHITCHGPASPRPPTLTSTCNRIQPRDISFSVMRPKAGIRRDRRRNETATAHEMTPSALYYVLKPHTRTHTHSSARQDIRI